MKHVLWVMLIVVGVTACSKVALNKDEFTALLIDMHMSDGVLSTSQNYNLNEKDNYMYYNDLFKKYGITRTEFDSCVTYYSGKSALFNKIYDAVIDTLSRRETEQMRVWKQLTVNDSINLFPGYTMMVDTSRPDSTSGNMGRRSTPVYVKRVVKEDTVYFDKQNPYFLVKMDSITPGMYKFSTTLRLNKREQDRRNYIRAYFLSDNNDTLKVRDVYVQSDTFKHDYHWTHYVVDSIYNQLVVKIIDGEDFSKVKKSKVERQGSVWNTQINKTYATPKMQERFKQQYLPAEDGRQRFLSPNSK